MTKDSPLYVKVSEALKDKIRKGEYEPGIQFTTEKKIKQEYGVSSITAVRVLEELEKEGIVVKKRGMGSFVTDNAKEILSNSYDESMDKPRAGRFDKARIIPIILPFELQYGGMLECFQGINNTLRDHDCYLIVIDSHRDLEEQEAKALKMQLDKNIDGLICYPQIDNKNIEIFNQFIINNIPIVMIDKYIDNLPVGYVVSDNFGGAKQLCEYAIEQGHKKIGFYCDGNLQLLSTLRQRYLGYTTVMSQYNIPISLDFVKNNMMTAYHEERKRMSGKAVEYSEFMANEILKMKKAGVTALLCQNDVVAIRAAKCCIQYGIKVPEDFMIMGFDNIKDIDKENLRDKIVTVEQDFYKMGCCVGNLMLKALDNPKKSHFEKCVVPVKLIK